MAELVTPESINRTLAALTTLCGQAADVARNLKQLRERAARHEDVSAERAASEDRLRDLMAEIDHLSLPLELLSAPTPGEPN
ncbi:MAG TPA: hypothetical protein VII56_08290 [Rhizomicrobium sp.]